ncbi:unnamed protein product [Echinostoma caproni]|uniref:Uncharacterized protein n=1 Tax=Echinostoma caproni TaxID=27848 RepID=A0A183ATI4_9TREM|nr:unnamed protein product [Echinostoma caproni]
MTGQPTDKPGVVLPFDEFITNNNTLITSRSKLTGSDVLKRQNQSPGLTPTRVALYRQLNVWLILSLVLVGSTVLFSLAFLVYRCRLNHSAALGPNAKSIMHPTAASTTARSEHRLDGSTDNETTRMFCESSNPPGQQRYPINALGLDRQNSTPYKPASVIQCPISRYPCSPDAQCYPIPGLGPGVEDTPV